MKKLIVLALLIFGGYKLYQNGALEHLPFLARAGAFDANGKAIARLFVGPNCERPCAEIESLLRRRHVDYELVDVSSPEAAKYHMNRYPVLEVGKDSVFGDDPHEIVGALASNFGQDVLTRTERIVMSGHFDESGRPVVVMYGTTWCPYCEQQRAFFASNGIPFQELNPETSGTAKTAYDILQGHGYPLTYVGYRRFAGYQGEEIRKAVARAH